MAKKVFFSFHYAPDSWRVSQVRNIGAIEGNQVVSDNEWEEITEEGDQAIENWINNQMAGKSCAVVMIGGGTAGRKWINYEIKKAWNSGKGVVGIHIHNLKNSLGEQSLKGQNPFLGFTVGNEPMSGIVKVYDPPYSTSTNVYDHIKENIEDWIDEAISVREGY